MNTFVTVTTCVKSYTQCSCWTASDRRQRNTSNHI